MKIISATSLCLLVWSFTKAHSHKRDFQEVETGEDDVDYFVLAFPTNYLPGTSKLQLLVTTMESELVPFSVETLRGYNISAVVNISTAITIDLPDSFEVINSSERDKGIRISAGDKQIAVYGLSTYNGLTSSAIFSALPCSRQNVSEYEYYGVTYEDGPHGYSELLFVACEDSTTVRIGSEIILLNETQTYLYTSETDLTGIRVVSDKPISFFSGHQCNNIPNDVNFCDLILEQLPNTAQWGKQFLSASLHTRNNDDIYSVVSYSPGTSVTFACTGQSVVTLTEFANNHETVVVPNNAFCAIESNNPILVVQYASGQEADYIDGDPFVMSLPSIEQYSNNYAAIVPSQYPTGVIAIYVPPEYYQPEKIFVNEMSQIEANWVTISCENQTICGYTAYIRVGAGKHSVYHYNAYARIGVSVYGFAYHAGYGYPAVGAQKSVLIAYQYPILTISTANLNGIFTAGQNYFLNCTIGEIGLFSVDTIEWDKVNDFAITTSNGSDYHQILKFNPLLISDGKSYKCAASVHYMDLHKHYEKYIELVVSLPELTMVIRRSYNGTVYAGTEFTLISDISFSDVSGVDVWISLDILWTRGSDVIVNGSRTTVSGVSGSGTSYTASLSFSPMTTSDSGQLTANVTVRLNLTSQYVQSVTSAADNDFVTVEELPALKVTISGNSSSTVGKDFSMTCSVFIVEHFHVNPILQWIRSGSDINSSGVTLSDTTHNEGSSVRTLTFSPLSTLHGAEYTCHAVSSIPSLSMTVTGSESRNMTAKILMPVVMVSGTESELVSGSPLSLTCSIQPSSVDTPTTVMSSWTAPNNAYNRVNAVNDTSVELMISSVETADSGDYICSARVTDSSGSEYTVDSDLATYNVSIIVKLQVTVRADYGAAPGEDPNELSPNEFTAGSILSLHCIAEGSSNGLTYEWSVTGNPDTSGCRCDVIPSSSTSTLTLAQFSLNSYHAGTYTCTVLENGRSDSRNSDTFTVTVVGAGIFADKGTYNSEYKRYPIANNGLIVSASDGLRLECVSNMSQLLSVVGNVTLTNGSSISVYTYLDYATTGTLKLNNPYNRPGVIRFQTYHESSIGLSDQGIYTCTIPDSNGKDIVINIGLYPYGFHYPPIITNLTYQEENRTLTCVSTVSPATNVSWMKDGQPLTTDGSSYYTLIQTVTDRASSTYSNVLTVSEGAPGGVAGTYTCTVNNELGSDSSEATVGSGLPNDPIQNNKSSIEVVIFVVAAVVVLLVIIGVIIGTALFFRKYIGKASERNPTGDTGYENKNGSPIKTSSNEAYATFKQEGAPEEAYELILPRIKAPKSSLADGTAISTTDNEAYGAVTEQSREPEAVYELIDSPSRQLTSSGNQENMCERPSLPPRHDDLPIPLPVPETAKEQEVYETI